MQHENSTAASNSIILKQWHNIVQHLQSETLDSETVNSTTINSTTSKTAT